MPNNKRLDERNYGNPNSGTRYSQRMLLQKHGLAGTDTRIKWTEAGYKTV